MDTRVEVVPQLLDLLAAAAAAVELSYLPNGCDNPSCCHPSVPPGAMAELVKCVVAAQTAVGVPETQLVSECQIKLHSPRAP